MAPKMPVHYTVDSVNMPHNIIGMTTLVAKDKDTNMFGLSWVTQVDPG